MIVMDTSYSTDGYLLYSDQHHRYLEWMPYTESFTWLAGGMEHAAVFSRDVAVALAARIRSEDGTLVRVIADHRYRAPEFTELPQAEGVRRVG